MKKFITVIVAGMILSLAGMNVYAQDKSEQQILQEKVSALVSSEISKMFQNLKKNFPIFVLLMIMHLLSRSLKKVIFIMPQGIMKW